MINKNDTEEKFAETDENYEHIHLDSILEDKLISIIEKQQEENRKEGSIDFENQFTRSNGAEISEDEESNAIPESTNVAQFFETNELFQSWDSLLHLCQDVGRTIKVVVVIISSENEKCNRKLKLDMGCERGGKTKPYTRKPGVKERKTGSKKIACSFLLRGRFSWDGTWTLDVVNGCHNHRLQTTMIDHSFAARLTAEQWEIIKELSSTGVAPKLILSAIKTKYADNVSSRKTIYIARAKIGLKELCGLSCLAHTNKCLEEADVVHFEVERCPSTHVVSMIFWAQNDGIKLLNIFPEVLVIDCTYKTNRYHFPLFEIVGVTSTGFSFNVAFVFMESAKKENYQWALHKLKALLVSGKMPKVFVTDKEFALINAIRLVFPEATILLCRWHVNNVIAAHDKKHFTNEDWTTFITDTKRFPQGLPKECTVNV